jgi:hypothetical protein
MNAVISDDIPTNIENEIPGNEHPTDPSELKPSLAPNSVTFADLLLSHQAILGEMQSFRIDLENFKKSLLNKPSWVTEFLEAATGLVSRVEKLEERLNLQEGICKFHHSNGADVPETALVK